MIALIQSDKDYIYRKTKSYPRLIFWHHRSIHKNYNLSKTNKNLQKKIKKV